LACGVVSPLITTEAAIVERPEDKPASPPMPDMGGMGF
jgi:chaperonin GroEL